MNKLTLKKLTAGFLTLMVLSLLVMPVLVSASVGDANINFIGTADIGLAKGNLISTINTLIRYILSFLGLVAVIIILWGGFLWMTSAGDDDKVAKARKLIISGIIGIVIILAAFIIANFAISTIGAQLGDGGATPWDS